MNPIESQSYLNKVVSRICTPGVLLLAVGAVLAYGSAPLAKKAAGSGEGKRFDRINLVIKAVGGVIALIGGLMALDIIG